METKIESKVIHTELKSLLAQRFDLIKNRLGIQNDAEVMRYLIQDYYNNHYSIEMQNAKEEVQKDHQIVQKFMAKYGEEWRKLGEDPQ